MYDLITRICPENKIVTDWMKCNDELQTENQFTN